MLDSKLQNPVETGVDICFVALRVEQVFQKVVTCDLLVTQRRPVDRGLRCRTALSVKNNDDDGEDFIHALLIAVVRILSSPQEQQLC